MKKISKDSGVEFVVEDKNLTLKIPSSTGELESILFPRNKLSKLRLSGRTGTKGDFIAVEIGKRGAADVTEIEVAKGTASELSKDIRSLINLFRKPLFSKRNIGIFVGSYVLGLVSFIVYSVMSVPLEIRQQLAAAAMQQQNYQQQSDANTAQTRYQNTDRTTTSSFDAENWTPQKVD